MNQKSASYQNFHHYIKDEWIDNEPKESFKRLAKLIKSTGANTEGTVLDVGCATGELLFYLRREFPGLNGTGSDIFDELLSKASALQPEVNFLNASVLELPNTLNEQFDITLAMGVMSIFDETQIETFWQNLLRVTKPNGHIFVFSPLNEYGVDTITRHRKRRDGAPLAWETGWNVFSQQTIEEIIDGLGGTLDCERFQIPFSLEKRKDPVRTWTIKTEENNLQLINGLKLMINHYFMHGTK